MNEGLSGGCLCGAVRFESRVDPQTAMHCCCVDGRKSSGTGLCTHAIVAEDAFAVTGEVNFHDRPADSGNIVTRGFRGTCGSPPVSRNSGWPGMIFARASVLDNPEAISPRMVVYADRAISWDTLDETIPAFAETAHG